MVQDLTKGPITRTLLRFSLPMMAGNLLQQMYNVADTLIVGQALGKDALAAVGSAYTLMTFLTSILLGLCLGSGTVFSLYYGKGDSRRLQKSIVLSFLLIGALTVVLNLLALWNVDLILRWMQVPSSVYGLMREYVWVVFWGISATFLYNFFASLLRAVGNSVVPLVFLGISAVLNIALDLLFVFGLGAGVAGAAWATVLSQFVSGIGLGMYTLIRFPELRPARGSLQKGEGLLRQIVQFSVLTCIQQSVMNLGILMVQGRVNSFGPAVMAAFAAAVKIDSFAYMPVQDFGNAFSTFVAQNHGAGQMERIRKGTHSAVGMVLGFCLVISAVVCVFARPLLLLFIQPQETEILAIGVRYLRIEGLFYCLIGFLFLFYGFYRAVRKPAMSVILTVISLGTRVALAYALSAIPAIGVDGIWVSVPIGWLLADGVGLGYYLFCKKKGNRLFSQTPASPAEESGE